MITSLKTLLCSILLLFILSGCWLEDKEEKYKGTVKGVSICIEKNETQSSLVSEDLIKKQCIRKHEHHIPIARNLNADTRSSINFDSEYVKLNVSGLDTLFEEYVITSIELSGRFYDRLEKEHINSEWVNGLWIEPNTSDLKVSVKMPHNHTFASDIFPSRFCSKSVGVEKTKFCKSWSIRNYKGLSITLD